MVGINTDKDPAKFRALCDEFGVHWDNVFNGDTGVGIPLAWGVSGYPTIYVLDASGTIVAEGLRGEELEKFVGDLVAKTKR
ncbi:MAG: hypothetical protein O3A20_02280 [Planctomycetota bacterium]|nr:hypothetical protein [Planctomycetota bacterium]